MSKKKPTQEDATCIAPEYARVGSIELSSENLDASELLSLILGALENDNVRKYLGLDNENNSRSYT